MKQRDTRSSDEKQRQKDVARDARKWPEVEKGLRQFLKLESCCASSNVFRMRHEFTFEWDDARRAHANKLMEEGMDFEDAYRNTVSLFAEKSSSPGTDASLPPPGTGDDS